MVYFTPYVKKGKSYLYSYCRECVKVRNRANREQNAARARVFRKRNPEKVKIWAKNNRDANKERYRILNRKYVLKKKYNLTYEQAAILLQGKCEVCGISGKLHLDHCHVTGLFRGVLCVRCNTSLGFLGENIERVDRLKGYIVNKCDILKRPQR